MDFFFIPDTCALAVHIACHEANIPLQLRELERSPTGPRLKNTDDASTNYMSLNPKGKVPAIKLQGGEILTENQTILQYIALELAPEKQLMPQQGLARWRAQELFNFITTDLHKGFSPLFNPDASPKHRNAMIRDLSVAFSVLQDILGDETVLVWPKYQCNGFLCLDDLDMDEVLR